MNKRIQRVNKLLKQEISSLILKEFDISKDILITVAEVETSSDLRRAKARISILPFLKAEKTLKFLNSQSFNFQKLLNKKLKMKSIPKIQFELDVSEERASKVEQLFKKIH